MAGRSRTRVWVVVVSGMLALVSLGAPSLAGAAMKDDSGLYVPKPDHGALAQIADLRSQGQKSDADLIESLIETPQAVWFTQGTPKQTQQSVKATVQRAKPAVPVLVAYNIPGRDCANLSAGGALTTAEYEAWIDGFAAGIGDAPAIVILEPDGLGLLPSNCGLDFPFTDTQRYAELNYAVDKLEAQPNAQVYLDGTHSAWLNAHDNATRLLAAGVQRAAGFFLNVSNYQFTPNLVQYGIWVSKCITLTIAAPNATCPDQYYNGGPLPSLIAQNFGAFGAGGSLSPYGIWSDTDPTIGPDGHSMPLNSGGENVRLAGVTGTTHFVIDTSRNGVGPWQFPTATYPDPQDWCNPPDRGVGVRPTLNTGVPLLDAYLWVKIPGQSDGSCARGLGPSGTTVDPEWGLVDPAAGQWFPQQALQLAQLANPLLLP